MVDLVIYANNGLKFSIGFQAIAIGYVYETSKVS